MSKKNVLFFQRRTVLVDIVRGEALVAGHGSGNVYSQQTQTALRFAA